MLDEEIGVDVYVFRTDDGRHVELGFTSDASLSAQEFLSMLLQFLSEYADEPERLFEDYGLNREAMN